MRTLHPQALSPQHRPPNPICLRCPPPHPVIVTIRDSRDYFRVLVHSYSTPKPHILNPNTVAVIFRFRILVYSYSATNLMPYAVKDNMTPQASLPLLALCTHLHLCVFIYIYAYIYMSATSGLQCLGHIYIYTCIYVFVLVYVHTYAGLSASRSFLFWVPLMLQLLQFSVPKKAPQV